MKRIIVIALVAIFSVTAKAQSTNSGGVQTTTLQVSNAIQISFTGASGMVEVPFTSLTDMLNGVETATHEVKISSNTPYKVTVKQSNDNMSYSGLALLGNLLQVSNIMKVRVMSNNTGGTQPLLAYLLGWQSFSANGVPVTLLSNCTAGNNKTFSVKYKVTPGISFAPGLYSVDMVYTATQQ